MAQFNIPKLARNKYNFVKGADGNNYVTMSQLMMASGGGGGAGGTSSTQVQSIIDDTLASRGLPVGYDIVSSYDLKTINGYSLIGQGDIEVSGSGTVDLSAYATKTYVADYVATYAPTADLSAYATKTYVADYVATYAPEPDLSAYVTHTELQSASYVTKIELDAAGYATSTYVADYVKTYAPTPDLSAYVSKTELSNASYLQTYTLTYAQYNNLSQAQKNDGRMYIISDMEYDVDMSYYVTKTELESASYVPYSELYKQLSSYATTTYVDEKVAGTILPSENKTYTIGNTSYRYDSIYANKLYTGYNSYIDSTSDYNIYFNINGRPRLYSDTLKLVPATNNAFSLGSSDRQYAAAYAQNIYINGVDLKTFIEDVVAGRV